MIQKIENFEHRWIEYVKRIQQVLLDNGYTSTLKDCADLWEDYSDSYCAGWLNMDSYNDEELFSVLESLMW